MNNDSLKTDESLCIAAYGFLVSEKETIPPSGPAHAGRGQRPAVPAGYRPRGAAATLAAPRAKLDRDPAHPARTHIRPRTAAMSLLRPYAPAIAAA